MQFRNCCGSAISSAIPSETKFREQVVFASVKRLVWGMNGRCCRSCEASRCHDYLGIGERGANAKIEGDVAL
jgi:hypothetical protein